MQSTNIHTATNDEQKEKDEAFRHKLKLPKGEYYLACMWHSVRIVRDSVDFICRLQLYRRKSPPWIYLYNATVRMLGTLLYDIGRGKHYHPNPRHRISK